MKIGGVDPRLLANEDILILPRGETNIVFRARGLPDMDEFNKLCPEPRPPKVQRKEGITDNTNDVNYLAMMAEYGKRRLAYMIVKSLEPSEIEWEKVNLNHPGTWASWEQELKDSGFTQIECNRVVQLVLDANCLNEEKLEKARKVFLLGLRVSSESIPGPSSELESSPSGEPASA